MYLFTGVVIWLIVLAVLYMTPSLYVWFSADQEQAKERVDAELRGLLRDFEYNRGGVLMGVGFASLILVIAWPFPLLVLSCVSIIALFGGLPYLLIRRLKNRISKTETKTKKETW